MQHNNIKFSSVTEFQVLYSCLPIYPQYETAHVLWSWNDNDPVNNVPSFHQFQGATSLNLLGGLVDSPQDPPDAQTFALTVNNVRKHFNLLK